MSISRKLKTLAGTAQLISRDDFGRRQCALIAPTPVFLCIAITLDPSNRSSGHRVVYRQNTSHLKYPVTTFIIKLGAPLISLLDSCS